MPCDAHSDRAEMASEAESGAEMHALLSNMFLCTSLEHAVFVSFADDECDRALPECLWTRHEQLIYLFSVDANEPPTPPDNATRRRCCRLAFCAASGSVFIVSSLARRGDERSDDGVGSDEESV
jgi:hypothetical protein